MGDDAKFGVKICSAIFAVLLLAFFADDYVSDKQRRAACAKEWAAFENKYDGTCMVQVMGKWVPAKNVQITVMGIAK